MEQAELIIADALDRLLEVVDESRIPRLNSDGRMRIVNSDVIADMIADIKTQLPEDIRRANSIVLQAEDRIREATDYAEQVTSEAKKEAASTTAQAEKAAKITINEADAYHSEKVSLGDDYLAAKKREGDDYYRETVARAKQEAERILAEARAQHEDLISENTITIEAQKRADELRNKTVLRSNQVYNNAKRSADDVLGALLRCLEDYYAAIEQDKKALEVRPAETERHERIDDARRQKGNEADGEGDGRGSTFFDIFKRKRRQHDDGDGDYDDGDA